MLTIVYFKVKKTKKKLFFSIVGLIGTFTLLYSLDLLGAIKRVKCLWHLITLKIDSLAEVWHPQTFFIKNDTIKPHVSFCSHSLNLFLSRHTFQQTSCLLSDVSKQHRQTLRCKAEASVILSLFQTAFSATDSLCSEALSGDKWPEQPEVTSKTSKSIQQNLSRRLKVEIWPRILLFRNSFIEL